VAAGKPSVSNVASPSASPAAVSPPSVSAAAAGAAGSGAAPVGSGGALQPLKVAVPNKGTAFSYLYVGKDLGIFAQRGLDLQILQVSPANAAVALQSGELDFAATVGSATRAALRGLPVRVVLVGLNETDFVLLGAMGTSSLEDVRGKSVSTDAPQTTSYNVAVEILRRHGLPPDSYTTVTASDDSGRAAAIASGLAAASIVEASSALPLRKQGYPLLATAEDLQLPFVGLAAGQAALQSRRDVLRLGVQAALDTLEVMHDDRARVVPVLAQEFALSEQDAGDIYDELQPAWALDGRPSAAALDFELSSDQRDMNLGARPTPDQAYDFSLLDELQTGGTR
jgi:NitT/TauT family transport system substrate-binding protein